MWKDKLEEIKIRRERRNRFLNDGCSADELNIFKQAVAEKFNYTLPLEYIDFLSLINGLEYNGLILYGIDENIVDKTNKQKVTGYIDSNEIWYENEWQKKICTNATATYAWIGFRLARTAQSEY